MSFQAELDKIREEIKEVRNVSLITETSNLHSSTTDILPGPQGKQGIPGRDALRHRCRQHIAQQKTLTVAAPKHSMRPTTDRDPWGEGNVTMRNIAILPVITPLAGLLLLGRVRSLSG